MSLIHGPMVLQIPVSAACREILQGMLQHDPNKRINLQEILDHPWFQQSLPDGALAMNDYYSNCQPLPEDVSFSCLPVT